MGSALESGQYGLVQVIDPGGRKEQGLRQGSEALGLAAQDKGTDLFRIRRAARFPGDEGRLAQLLQPMLQSGDLGRLACALSALESNETPCHQILSTTLEKARLTQPVLNSSKPSKARWLRVPSWTSSLAYSGISRACISPRLT